MLDFLLNFFSLRDFLMAGASDKFKVCLSIEVFFLSLHNGSEKFLFRRRRKSIHFCHILAEGIMFAYAKRAAAATEKGFSSEKEVKMLFLISEIKF